MIAPTEIADLPGGDNVVQGLRDLEAGKVTRDSLLVTIAAPALQRLGLSLPPLPNLDTEAELHLYRTLQEEGTADPYSAYNALLRLIVSFTRALAQRVRLADY